MASLKRTSNTLDIDHHNDYSRDDTIKKSKIDGSSGNSNNANTNAKGNGNNNGNNNNTGGHENKEEPIQEVRCLIDNHSVGGIIGKGGQHVKRVRDETSVFVSILKSEHKAVKERVMVLKGQSERIAKAFHLIAEHLVASSQQSDKKGFSSNNEISPESTVIKLLVHKSVVGAVIGKGGSVIKDTQQETSTKVQVSNEPLPNSTEKTISITGTPSAIHRALGRILVQLKENPVRSGTRVVLYIPGPPVFPPLASPYAFPSPYPLLYGQQPPLYPVKWSSELGALTQSLRSMSLHAPSLSSPLHMYGNSNGQGQGSHSSHNSSVSSHASSSSSSSSHSSSHNNHIRQELPIPSICAGGIIGKGGSVIRDLRASSGTSISIAAEQNNERIVTVSGPPHGVQQAIYFIRQLVDQYQPHPSHSSHPSSHSSSHPSSHQTTHPSHPSHSSHPSHPSHQNHQAHHNDNSQHHYT